MKLLKIHHLEKKFRGNDGYAVRDFSLEVEKGEIVALLGESGCGKTTVLRSIAGLETPDKGTIEMNGRILTASRRFIPPEKRGVGIVFQDFALFPHLNVFKNIGFGLREPNKKARRERIQYLIKLVGLDGLENRYTHQLSGGQKQRVALARALAPSPELILLDEPFSSIDSMFKDQMHREIWKILKETRTTCIFVTHDTSDVMPVADKVALMKDGVVCQYGSPSEIYLKPKDCYVARFFGKTNILRARSVKNGFETSIGFIPYTNGPANNKEVMLSIRPEGFRITEQPQKPEECLCGKLKNISFFGQYQEVVCTVPANNGEDTEITLYVDQMKPCHSFHEACYFQPIKEHIQVLDCL